jgi:hypothetical protein
MGSSIGVRLLIFFRRSLLQLKTEQDVISFLKGFDREVEAIKEELLRMCWYMRGGLTYTEAHNLDQAERKLIGKIIDSNLEITKQSKLPFF